MGLLRRKKRLLIGGGISFATYVALYLINTALGGYDPYYTSDGRNRYNSGLLVHDCIMWQPRFGTYYNEYRRDALGLAFSPLMRLDQRYFHRTHSMLDDDFQRWWLSLTDSDIHPRYRADYRRWKAVAAKYQEALTAAEKRGNTKEVHRILDLIQEESDNPQ